MDDNPRKDKWYAPDVLRKTRFILPIHLASPRQDCCDASDEGEALDPQGCREELLKVAGRIGELLLMEQKGEALKWQMLEMGRGWVRGWKGPDVGIYMYMLPFFAFLCGCELVDLHWWQSGFHYSNGEPLQRKGLQAIHGCAGTNYHSRRLFLFDHTGI